MTGTPTAEGLRTFESKRRAPIVEIEARLFVSCGRSSGDEVLRDARVFEEPAHDLREVPELLQTDKTPWSGVRDRASDLAARARPSRAAGQGRSRLARS
jgi:hypothetical protein